uniref:pre-mRNA-processing factor 39-like n=1 Tax=Ciona intestinalis TaxID=7719 RepID=UPI000180D00B|nr:pre-mRNA-processing factor 39-like [Ciona intestinalis]|eukprot:XP_002123360.1 pre-mRNA-processing factor 39-like [Ciona intestinalis]
MEVDSAADEGANYVTLDTVSNHDGDSDDGKDDEKIVEEETRSKSPEPISDVEDDPEVGDPPCFDDDSIPIVPEEEVKVKVKESEEYLRYWKMVVDSPHDFTAWTYLLQLVEQDRKMALARRAYNNFFKRYPLCYGYWKKFSEIERKKGNLIKAQVILERGVRAIPLSIDLWVHVIDFYIKHYKGPDAGSKKVRIVFERAMKAAGEEFRSEKLWNKYIKWEIDNKNWINVMKLYDRAMSTQTQHYSIFFNDLKEFVNTHAPQDLLMPEAFEKLLSEVRVTPPLPTLEKREQNKQKEKAKKNPDAIDIDSESDEDEGATVDDVDMEEAPPGVEEHEKPPNEEEQKHMRQLIIKEKKKIFEATERIVTKIWAFEEGVKRPYFHVKQLERAQLKNWREYLDMEINNGNHHRIVLLFERCLIACALYEDFWLKYAKYMSNHDVVKAGKIYERACTIHLPKKPTIHMQWAAHEELQGNTSTAIEILENLNKVLPGMAMIKMRRVALQRRAGNIQAAEDILISYVTVAEKDKEILFYTRKLAWFLFKISNKKDEARKLLKDLIPKFKEEINLYNDLVEMEFQHASTSSNDQDELLALEAFDLAIANEKFSEDQKFSFSQRKLEFLEDYGCDVKRLQKTYEEHQKLVRSQKKRHQSEAGDASNPAAKKAKTDTPITVVASTPNQLSNGSRYSATSSTAPVSYVTTPTQSTTAAYSATDPSLYYQQNYWNYQQKASENPQYNYSQWSQYYQQQQGHQ